MNIQTSTQLRSNFRNLEFYFISIVFFGITILLVPFLIDNGTINTTLLIYGSVLMFFPMARALNSEALMDPDVSDFADILITIPIWIVVGLVTLVLGIIFIPIMLMFPSSRFRLMYIGSAIIIYCFGVRVKITGSLPKTGPYIICPNHTSFIDYFLSTYIMGWNNKYTVVHGSNLHNIPIIGWVMRNCLTSIDRSDKTTYFPMITEMREALMDKKNVLIYPEGGRITERERKDGLIVKPFKNGAFKVADSIGCLIVPVTIKGAYKFKPKASKRLWLRPGMVEIIYHKPIEPIGKVETVAEKTRQMVMSAL